MPGRTGRFSGRPPRSGPVHGSSDQRSTVRTPPLVLAPKIWDGDRLAIVVASRVVAHAGRVEDALPRSLPLPWKRIASGLQKFMVPCATRSTSPRSRRSRFQTRSCGEGDLEGASRAVSCSSRCVRAARAMLAIRSRGRLSRDCGARRSVGFRGAEVGGAGKPPPCNIDDDATPVHAVRLLERTACGFTSTSWRAIRRRVRVRLVAPESWAV